MCIKFRVKRVGSLHLLGEVVRMWLIESKICVSIHHILLDFDRCIEQVSFKETANDPSQVHRKEDLPCEMSRASASIESPPVTHRQ